jgi:hypothetical protein
LRQHAPERLEPDISHVTEDLLGSPADHGGQLAEELREFPRGGIVGVVVVALACEERRDLLGRRVDGDRE